MAPTNHWRSLALPCRRCYGCVEKHESTTRLEAWHSAKLLRLKSHSQLSTCSYGCMSLSESCFEYRRGWPHELLAISTRRRTSSQSRPQVFKIGNVQVEDWCKLEADFLQRISCTNPLWRFWVSTLLPTRKWVLRFSKSQALCPTEILELFNFVEVTLVQCATVAGHLPGDAVAAVKVKPKKVNKVEVTQEEPPKKDVQACAVTPRAKSKGPNRSAPPRWSEDTWTKEDW